jgi:signal transduction histidine kinase
MLFARRAPRLCFLRVDREAETMIQESVLERITDNLKLPSPPTLTLRVLEQANRPSGTLAEIGKIISLDPVLCGKMLKLVNSSLFGLQRTVTSLDRALNLLGLNHVRSLVLSLSLTSLRFKNASSARMKSYWKSSVTVAIVCRELAALRKWRDPDSEMVAGLLCDLGTMLLQETFPQQYAKVTSSPAFGKDLCTREANEIGVDHAEAGAHFLGRWNLPDDLTQSIRYHHRPAAAPASYRERAQLLAFACGIADIHQGADKAVLMAEIVAQAHEQYGLRDEQLFSFLDSLAPKVKEFAALIDVNLGPLESFSGLFARAAENLSQLAVEASLDSARAHEEKVQVEQSLRAATEALQRTEEQLRQAQKMEAIGRLAGGLAHDFNNLLTVILGNCELLFELPSLGLEGHELVEVIKETGCRASTLTRQLLAFSRKQVLVPEVLCLNTVVTNMSKMLERLLGTEVRIHLSLAEDVGRVVIDRTRIEQVIMNLAVNSRDAMPRGGVLTIETFNMKVGADVAARNPEIQPGNFVVLVVRDSGCGMDENVLRQIFEPFFTTKEIGKGTGLGLATVHGIVRQSGGHITVSSEIGIETVFHIYLPAAY